MPPGAARALMIVNFDFGLRLGIIAYAAAADDIELSGCQRPSLAIACICMPIGIPRMLDVRAAARQNYRRLQAVGHDTNEAPDARARIC